VDHATTVLNTKRKKEIELEVGKQVFLFTFTPIVKSGYSNVYGLDVTEKKKMEVKLSKYSKDLEDLVKERSSQLDVAEHQLVKAERLAAIGELAGMIGHDLRNPLTGIKTSIYYLKKNNLNAMEPKSREMIEVVEKCIDHSNKIINDLLEYSKEVQLEPQTSTPETLISETVAMLKTPSTVTIINQVTSQTSLHVDFDKMKRVFSNLIKNSIEAMPGGGKVTITCKPVKDCLEFCVADTGPGIPPQVLAKIFTPLVTTKAQGMGFGLAICKRIVEAHDGVITVETGGKGTCFTVKVPAKH
jgi:signal transduction histidine kinase